MVTLPGANCGYFVWCQMVLLCLVSNVVILSGIGCLVSYVDTLLSFECGYFCLVWCVMWFLCLVSNVVTLSGVKCGCFFACRMWLQNRGTVKHSVFAKNQNEKRPSRRSFCKLILEISTTV
jgi:hypothetical protein